MCSEEGGLASLFLGGLKKQIPFSYKTYVREDAASRGIGCQIQRPSWKHEGTTETGRSSERPEF